MNNKEEGMYSILEFLNESLPDDPESREDEAAYQPPYFSGVEESDNTDVNPDYLPSDVGSTRDNDNVLEQPFFQIAAQDTGLDTIDGTIETVNAAYCHDYPPAIEHL